MNDVWCARVHSFSSFEAEAGGLPCLLFPGLKGLKYLCRLGENGTCPVPNWNISSPKIPVWFHLVSIPINKCFRKFTKLICPLSRERVDVCCDAFAHAW